MNWKITFTLLGVILISLIVAFSDQIGAGVNKAETYYTRMFHQSIAKGLYEGFKKTADKMNQHGPVMENKYVRFDKSRAGPGPRITYYYTLVKHSSQEIDRNRLSARLKTSLVSAVCKSNKVKPSILLGATYAYVYRGNDGVEVSRIEINQDSCETQSVQSDKP